MLEELMRALRRAWLRKRIEWAESDLADLDPLLLCPLHVINHRIHINRLRAELEALG